MESDELTPHPFQVEYDAEEEECFIFAPPGCVLVDGKAVEIADVDSAHNVALDLDPDDLPDTLWAHVTEDSTATGGYKVEFDGNETKTGSEWDFCVARFGAAENDGDQYDVCSSVVSLSTHKPHAWEIRYDSALNDGAGGWKIYLSEEQHVLSYDGGYLTLSSSTSALADGWYTMDNVSLSDSHAWLVVTVSKPQSYVIASAVISNAPGTAGTGETVYNYCIASLYYVMSVGGPLVEIYQSLVGALHLGGGDGGSSASPDGVSIDDDGSNGALEIKDWANSNRTTSVAVAADMGASSPTGDQVVVRSSNGALKYKPVGQLVRASDTNIVFTQNGNNLEIGVYYA